MKTQHHRTPKITRPAFKPKFHIEIVPEEAVFVLSEAESFVWEGEHALKVIPLIDGKRTIREIVRVLKQQVASSHVYETIQRLSDAGQIEESDSSVSPEVGAFWSQMDIDVQSRRKLIETACVRIVALDSIDPRPLASAIKSLGIRVADRSPFAIVLVNDYLSTELQAFNLRSLANRSSWMLMKPDGVSLWVGPIFVPGRTACWSCLAHRLKDNRVVEGYIQRKTGIKQPFPVSRARMKLLGSQAYALAAVQIARWLARGTNPELESQLLVAEPVTLRFNLHVVVRRPQCPNCGDPNLIKRPFKPIFLNDRRVLLNGDNGSRQEPPEITFDRFRHHISPITGVVHGIYPSPMHNNSIIRTYSSGHNFAFKDDSLYFVKMGVRTQSMGKGKGDAQARTSALCEALERYSGVFQNDEPRIRCNFHELKGAAIHPNSCMLFSENQYKMREAPCDGGLTILRAPRVLDKTARIEWSPVYSYSQKRQKYLPTSYLYYGYQATDDQVFAYSDSNGNAAGVSLEDACLQGALELIERDSVALWWYNRLRRPQVDLDSFKDPYFQELRSFYANIGRQFWVLDLTTDVEIPAFVAITRRCDARVEDIVLGFGSHVDPIIGITRAVTEMNQSLPFVHRLDKKGKSDYDFNIPNIVSWLKSATLEKCPYLQPLPPKFNKKAKDYRAITSSSPKQQLQYCYHRIEQLGMEILLLNQSRPDIGLTVVKTIIPGMRHFWPRFGPGRLYDVPVKMGLVKKATLEQNLNPIPMPF